MAESILNSWKDIAAHLHTSVRTAQRWEATMHLPVHRPGNGRKGPILAFTGELNDWLKNGKSRVRRVANGNGTARHDTAEKFQNTQHNLDALLDLAKRIAANTVVMQKHMQRALALRQAVDQSRAAGKLESARIAKGSHAVFNQNVVAVLGGADKAQRPTASRPSAGTNRSVGNGA